MQNHDCLIDFAYFCFTLAKNGHSGSLETPSGSLETPSGSLETPSGSLETPSGSLETSSGSLETSLDHLTVFPLKNTKKCNKTNVCWCFCSLYLKQHAFQWFCFSSMYVILFLGISSVFFVACRLKHNVLSSTLIDSACFILLWCAFVSFCWKQCDFDSNWLTIMFYIMFWHRSFVACIFLIEVQHFLLVFDWCSYVLNSFDTLPVFFCTFWLEIQHFSTILIDPQPFCIAFTYVSLFFCNLLLNHHAFRWF